MKIKANLISGRTADQGAHLEAKTHKGYFDACAYCELNSADLEKLGASEGDSLKVTTEFGDVVVFAKANGGNPDGLAFIPMGPWANAVLTQAPSAFVAHRDARIPCYNGEIAS